MLSKVIGRVLAAEVPAMVFPAVVSPAMVSPATVFPPSTGYQPAFGARASSEGLQRNPLNPDGGDYGGLEEKLRRLEAQSIVDCAASFEAGKRQGEQQARTELQPVLDRVNQSLAEVLGMRSDLRRRAERDVVQLALLIAKRVLHRQLSVDEGALTAIARIAFERLTRAESYRVTVHPQFAAAITSALPGSHAARVRIDPDPDCALGTFIIHSAEGIIDASVDAQLAEINRGLTDRLASA